MEDKLIIVRRSELEMLFEKIKSARTRIGFIETKDKVNETKFCNEIEEFDQALDILLDIMVDGRASNIFNRLFTYRGPHSGEEWKLERNLAKCTSREKEEMKKLGLSVEQLMALGLNRGQVHHILFGWKHS